MLQLMPLDLLLSLLQLEKAKTQAKNCFCEKHSPILVKRNVFAFNDIRDSGLEKLRNLLTIYLLFQKILFSPLASMNDDPTDKDAAEQRKLGQHR